MSRTVCSADTSAIVSRMPGPNPTLLRQRDSEKRSVLRNHYLFSKLSPKHIDSLASCIVGKTTKRNSTIFAKGDPGSSLFAICKGAVKITVPSVDGHDAVFNLIGKGDIFEYIPTATLDRLAVMSGKRHFGNDFTGER